jgi:hypothetical protein
MNLDRLLPLFFFVCLVLGGLIANLRGDNVLHGAAIGMAVGLSPLALLGIAYFFIQKWAPDRPPCVCGACASDDYEFLDSLSDIKEHVYFYRCPACGREYRTHGGKFSFNTPEGVKPYMKTSRWGRWVKDEAR